MTAAAAAADKKAEDLVVLHVAGITPVTDYMVICSGRNPLQVQAIAEHILETMRAAGLRPLNVEGLREGRWVLLDYGDVVVHVFNPEARAYYALERLWGDAEWIDVTALEA